VTNIPTRKTGLYFCWLRALISHKVEYITQWLRGVVVIDDVRGSVTVCTCNPGTLRVGQGAVVASLYGPAGHAPRCTGDSRQPVSCDLALCNFPCTATRQAGHGMARQPRRLSAVCSTKCTDWQYIVVFGSLLNFVLSNRFVLGCNVCMLVPYHH